MEPLYDVTSALLLVLHGALDGVVGLPHGASWAIAVIGMTVAVRLVLLPVFVRQILNRRKLQALQPRLEELRRDYGHDRKRLREETMKLYRESGTSPYVSWLPLLVTLPVAFALFHTLNGATASDAHGVGLMSDRQAAALGDSMLFGVVRLSDPAIHSGRASATILAVFLVVVMSAASFVTVASGTANESA